MRLLDDFLLYRALVSIGITASSLFLKISIFIILKSLTSMSTVYADELRFGSFVVNKSEPTAIYLNGVIQRGDFENFKQALEHSPEARTIVLDSPGGNVGPSLQIADKLYASGLSTVIQRGAACMSACATIFFAGAERHVHGKLGVHQMSGVGAELAQFAASEIVDRMTRFEVPTDVLAIMLRTPSNTMYIFDDDEIARFNINRSHPISDGVFGNYPLASCAGWNGTIEFVTDIDGEEARMSGLITESDIVEYCERDPGGITIMYGGTKTIGQCVEERREIIGTRLRAVANCETGVLRFFYGSTNERTLRMPLPGDRSCASGLPPLISQFKKLCPRLAHHYGLLN